LDIRSNGGYIVGAGSIIDGKKYTIQYHGLAECPQWIIDKCGQTVKRKNLKIVTNIDQGTIVSRVTHYLKVEAPIAIEGDGGDETTYKVACHLKDLGCDLPNAFKFMWDHWNEYCQPPWEPEELEIKIQNAYAYGSNPIGVKSPQTEFKPIIKETKKSYLEEMNDTHALVYEEGGHSILFETKDEKGRARRVFFNSLAAFIYDPLGTLGQTMILNCVFFAVNNTTRANYVATI